MAFDGTTIAAVRKELSDSILGGRIYKIAQPVVGVADGSMLIQMLLPIEEVIKELHAAGDSGNNRLPPAFPLRLM